MFSAYLARSKKSVTSTVFFDLFRRLSAGSESIAGSASKRGVSSCIPLLPAYEAEGLLALCSIILARIPSPVLLRQWEFIVPILTAYLAHSASTVRQVWFGFGIFISFATVCIVGA